MATSSVAVAAGLGVAQVLAYALNVLAARRLGPESFGVFAALLSVILIGNTVALGVQVVAARSLSTADRTRAPHGAQTLLRFAWRCGLVVAVGALVLVPVITVLLRLDGPAGALLVVVSLVPLTGHGGQLGAAQGREAFGRLALLYALMGVAKSVGGMLGVVAFGDAVGGVLGLVLGCACGAVVAVLLVRPLARVPASPVPALGSQTARATVSLLALFALTNVDVLLARHFLTPVQAGTYAVGSLVAKVAFFAPSFVTVVAFPRMTREGGARASLLAAAATGLVGAVFTVAVALNSTGVVALLGGASYAGLAPSAWLFAALGSVYAVVQVLVYSRLAVDDRVVVVAMWTAVVALVAGVWAGPHDSVEGIVTTALVVAGALVVVGIAADLRASRQRAGTVPLVSGAQPS